MDYVLRYTPLVAKTNVRFVFLIDEEKVQISFDGLNIGDYIKEASIWNCVVGGRALELMVPKTTKPAL
jgi:hypothetical protein